MHDLEDSCWRPLPFFAGRRAWALAFGLAALGCTGGVDRIGSFVADGGAHPDAGGDGPTDAAAEVASRPDLTLPSPDSATLGPEAAPTLADASLARDVVASSPDAAARLLDAATSDALPPDAASDVLDAAASDALPPDAARPPPPEPRTALDPAGRLVLTGAGPARLADCAVDTPCADADADQLSDAWEAIVLDRLRPRLVFDEDEHLVNDPNGAVLAFVGRVSPAGDDATHVRVFLMIGYSEDYGSCGLTAHHGDSERVALDLAPLAGGAAGDVTVAGLYTAAHEGTIRDHSRVYRGQELLERAVFTSDATDHGGAPRWTVFPSANKHGTYINVGECESVSIIPCLDEDCGPDGVAPERLPAYIRLPPVFDAGEPGAPRLRDLSALGFPAEDAWADQDFCGGLGGDTCSASVREKLLLDPFLP